MCLAVPGEVAAIDHSVPENPLGRVNFGGVMREVCLAYVPDVQVGDYVIVHAGFAISVLDQAEALETIRLFQDMDTAV